MKVPGCVKSGFWAGGVGFSVRHEVRRTDGEVCGVARPALRLCAPLLHVTERVRTGSCGLERYDRKWPDVWRVKTSALDNHACFQRRHLLNDRSNLDSP